MKGAHVLEVPFYDPALRGGSEEKNLIHGVKATRRPLQVANKRRLHSPPAQSPGCSGIGGVAAVGGILEERERALLIKRIRMENERGGGKAGVKRGAVRCDSKATHEEASALTTL